MFVLRALQPQFGSRVSQLTVKTFWRPEKWPTKNRGSRSFPKVPKGITGLFARLERRQGPPHVVSTPPSVKRLLAQQAAVSALSESTHAGS